MNATTSIPTPKPEKKEILPNAIYLTDEAAALLGVMTATIRAAVRRGTIRGQGRPFRIRGSELFKLA
jgi:excisionase family DNA binding protein